MQFFSAYLEYILNKSPENMAASSPPVPALISRKISLVSFGSLSTNSFSKYPPKSTMRRFEISNNKKVEEKLVKAFLLASHGEYASAAKEAALISKNTKDKKLGKL